MGWDVAFLLFDKSEFLEGLVEAGDDDIEVFCLELDELLLTLLLLTAVGVEVVEGVCN